MKFKFHWTDIGFFICLAIALYLSFHSNPTPSGLTAALIGAILFLYYRMGLVEGRMAGFEERMSGLEGRMAGFEEKLPERIRDIIREELGKKE
jgi:hypothetical protein